MVFSNLVIPEGWFVSTIIVYDRLRWKHPIQQNETSKQQCERCFLYSFNIIPRDRSN